MADTTDTTKTDLGRVTVAPEDRLAELKAEKDRADKAKRVYDAGFDEEAHYDAWQTLEELRALTKALRKADEPVVAHVRLHANDLFPLAG